MTRVPIALLFLVAACTEQSERTSSGPPAKTSEVARPEQEELADLGALGYVSYSEEEGDSPEARRDGVVFLDSDLRSPGYDLYTDVPLAQCSLIDAQGKVLRSWSSTGDQAWQRAELAPNGDLLVVGVEFATAGDPGLAEGTLPRFLQRMAFDGRLLWRRRLPVHHDVDVLPDGRLLVLTDRFHDPGERFPAAGVIDNGVAMLDPEGNLLEEISLFEILDGAPELFRWPRIPRKAMQGEPVELLHCNSVQWIDHPEAATQPAWSPGVVLLASRHLNAVLAVSWSLRKLLWVWGQGELLGPHEAQWTASGHVLLIDNGAPDRGWSRVVEVDPLAGRIVWQWRREPPEDFWTPAQGTVQLLPRGNLLVGNSNAGEAFEITREGKLAWRFLNPARDAERGGRAVLRIRRYPPDLVEPLLR